ncbi:hypothetical protein BCAR13_1520011 [Paraburkholderia caribensis]|nr:hypothetical protein BCAR13_1520011 [Paraburkholderia caribensis]
MRGRAAPWRAPALTAIDDATWITAGIEAKTGGRTGVCVSRKRLADKKQDELPKANGAAY